MNAYFVIVLLAVVLFFVVWGMGWVLERLSLYFLDVTRNPGSRAWRLFVGPGVALHESSHALGCLFTRTKIIEFKPINVSEQDDKIVLGYVTHEVPDNAVKGAVIGLAPVAVSLVLLTFFALAATYLVPASPGIGGEALSLLSRLIQMKGSEPSALEPVWQIGSFVYLFFYTLAGLTVINPLFWLIAFLALTIMLSNAPSDTDIKNSATGLKYIMVFDLIWLVVAYFVPAAGWLLFGLFELLAVMFALAAAFGIVAYGLFLAVAGAGQLRTPFNTLPFIACIVTGAVLAFMGIGTPAFQTVVSVAVLAGVVVLLLMVRGLRRAVGV